MRFSVVVPGQPVSVDEAYRTGLKPIRRRGVPVLGPDGLQRYIHAPILTRKAELWRDAVQINTQVARPSRFHPTGQLRVVIDLHLANDMDADNTLKLIMDGVERGLGLNEKGRPIVNDSRFLPCFRSKEWGLPLRDARVILEIDDDPT